MEAGPKPKPVTARIAVNTQGEASVMAQISRPENPMTISTAPRSAVLRKPQRTTSGAATKLLSAHMNITGVTTPAAAITPPPRPP